MSQASVIRLPYAGPPQVPGYVLDEFIGRGSSGAVWSARCQDSGERVAVKVVGGDFRQPDGPMTAVTRELEIGTRITSSHVVRARDHVVLEDGRAALVLDLADGGTLRDVVTIRMALPLGEVVTTFTPLATALAELHASGITHADIAPGNVLFSTDGRPMLADFASARLPEEAWSQVTVGTSGFTAPEVLGGLPPTPASDVWSLGALIWYARTSAAPPPWLGDAYWPRAVRRDRYGDDASPGDGSLDDTSIDEVASVVGPELRPLLVRMLADDPQVRPTAAEAALALYRVAVPEPVVLVGHHPDPAAAVTNRIRRAAAETRSRSQLRAMESAEQKRVARARRRDLVARHVTTAFRVGARPRAGVVTSPEQEQSRSVRRRVGLVVVVAVLLAAGMMSLMRLAEGSTAETSLTLAVADTATAGTGPTEPTGSNSGAEGAGSTLGRGVNGPAGAVEASAEGPVAELGSNPAAALQRVADARAAALSAADPVALLRAEPAGTTAYEADSRVIARLRAERQRYVSLRFTVRSAEMVSSSAGQAVVRAQVDREGCTVAGEDGSSQVLPAQPGSSLRYSLALVDGEWRITDVASG